MKLLILTALLITGCSHQHQYWQITCDSGFETPVSQYTFISNGVLKWKIKGNDYFTQRKMLPGESCNDVQVMNHE